MVSRSSALNLSFSGWVETAPSDGGSWRQQLEWGVQSQKPSQAGTGLPCALSPQRALDKAPVARRLSIFSWKPVKTFAKKRKACLLEDGGSKGVLSEHNLNLPNMSAKTCARGWGAFGRRSAAWQQI
ncbi:hypothetical protein WJX72_008593 [[Myrmecia] bisecta]|uniref:Uncharacterized protein n=1 Tax=[Myrmecia] bisecta TaxID=41462 RepID=A0AAW1QFP6_9CHLO